jgi:hypothetical protein
MHQLLHPLKVASFPACRASKKLGWLVGLAIATGYLVAAPPAEAGTVIIRNGGVVVSTPGFFLSIGRPVVIYQPVVVYQPVYRFPRSSHGYVTPHYRYSPHYPYYGRPPLAIDDRLGADITGNSPNGARFQDVRTLSPLNVQPAVYTPITTTSPSPSTTTLEARPVEMPIVLPASAIPTTPLPESASTTERVISNPSPFDRSLMEMME